MSFTNLDTIVKGLLIERGYPIHYYMQFLYLSSRAYEELHFDSLGNVKTISIPINSYKAVPIPCDFMDWVKVGIPNGQFVRPLSSREGLTSLNNFDSSGNKVSYSSKTVVDSLFFDNRIFAGAQTFYNENGEFTGRLFGIGAGDNVNTFKYIPERNEFQLHEGIVADNIILQYISDGSSIDNATMITPYAKAGIEAYIVWKMKAASRAYGEGERAEAKRQFDLQHRLLRARKNELTKDKIFSIVRKHTHGSIKG